MIATLFMAWFMPTIDREPIPPKPTYSHIVQAPQTPEAQLETDAVPLTPVQIVTGKHKGGHKGEHGYTHRCYSKSCKSRGW